MRVMVTGGAGFLGSHVAEVLRAAGHEVLIFDVQEPRWLSPSTGFKYFPGDLLSPASLAVAMEGIESVCHLGGVGDVYLATKEPQKAAQANDV